MPIMNRSFGLFLSILILATFLGLSNTVDGYFIRFGGGFTQHAPGELRFWLASILLVFPAAVLLGWFFQSEINKAVEKIASWTTNLSKGERKKLFIFIFFFSLAAALIGNRFILYGYPLTDDELGSVFGAKIWLQGHLTMPLPEPFEAFKHQFMYVRDGRLANMDFPGNLAIWALDHLLGLQGGIFSLAAAFSGLGIAVLLYFRLSMGWALLGVLLFWLSPMASSLSFSTHQHQLSRAAFSLFLAATWVAYEKPKARWWLFSGFLASLMALFRPLEATFLISPFFIFLVNRFLKKTNKKSHLDLLLFLIGALPLVLLFAWYNHQLTGQWWLPPRFAIPDVTQSVSPVFSLQKLWLRFSTNMGENLFLLLFWPLGPLGLVLFLLGVGQDRFTKCLGLGVACDLVLALLHDIPGINVVGPIHYSECVIPIIILGVHGVHRLLRATFLTPHWRQTIGACGLTALSLGMGLFSWHHWSALHDSAKIADSIHGAIELRLADARPSIITGPTYLETWQNIPHFLARGTWVYEWPTVSPDFSDPIIFAASGYDEALRKKFPEREFYRLILKPEYPYLHLAK